MAPRDLRRGPRAQRKRLEDMLVTLRWDGLGVSARSPGDRGRPRPAVRQGCHSRCSSVVSPAASASWPRGSCVPRRLGWGHGCDQRSWTRVPSDRMQVETQGMPTAEGLAVSQVSWRPSSWSAWRRSGGSCAWVAAWLPMAGTGLIGCLNNRPGSGSADPRRPNVEKISRSQRSRTHLSCVLVYRCERA